MLKYKISKIAKSTNRSYRSAKRRVEILAPVMIGGNEHQKLSAACDMILDKIEKQSIIFRNVDFRLLYRDII